ncbi:MAG: 50S ribosomal protein L4 [Nanoarchaeota archaeon]|nr:50S ribosomal protein L4 [Nanoarchaeota archaeon]MBU1269127.1 50S ribosomal protein L4 [Nanoarchaeota archaeon]MBU1605089.1 50S ribosomal protein L4 [Nanoarchaeota archaeon]MBU2442770.1 50S ribosomal protein L4 [Nanoarchaeota archaeon]
MKLKILNLEKTETGSVELPNQFYKEIRRDLIKRAFLTIQSNKRQPYGSDPRAGKRASADVSRRRRNYRGSYGFGISRVPRKILSRRGTRMVWVGAFAPGMVGGRRAHPPKAEKNWSEGINKKERRKAICAAISATINLEAVKSRGHKIPKNYPFIISNEIVTLQQTKKLRETLIKLGFEEELQRTKTNNSKGLLIVTADKAAHKTFANIPGFEVTAIQNLDVEKLAPGGVCGRMTIFTESAIKELKETQIFTTQYKTPKVQEAKTELKKEKTKEKKKTTKVESKEMTKEKKETKKTTAKKVVEKPKKK